MTKTWIGTRPFEDFEDHHHQILAFMYLVCNSMYAHCKSAASCVKCINHIFLKLKLIVTDKFNPFQLDVTLFVAVSTKVVAPPSLLLLLSALTSYGLQLDYSVVSHP